MAPFFLPVIVEASVLPGSPCASRLLLALGVIIPHTHTDNFEPQTQS
jgi:hypothetical protein